MSNRLFIGIDEAGYGPNLGPLTVARSVWETAEHVDEQQLIDKLSRRFRCDPWSSGSDFIPLGDSKRLYQGGRSLRALEIGLLAMLAQLGPIPVNLLQLERQLALSLDDRESLGVDKKWNDTLASAKGSQDAAPDIPWYAANALECLIVPERTGSVSDAAHQQWREEIARTASLAQTYLDEVGVRLLDLRVVVIREWEFNQHLQLSQSKAKVLADATMRLVTDAISRWPADLLSIYCDRQGGRKDYLPMLLDAMPDEWFSQLRADAARSSYRRQRSPEFDIHFSVQGDSFPPTALASMFAKYCRERYMQAFNAFWQTQVEALRPTAGYPVDAVRFRDQVSEAARQLLLQQASWWRLK